MLNSMREIIEYVFEHGKVTKRGLINQGFKEVDVVCALAFRDRDTKCTCGQKCNCQIIPSVRRIFRREGKQFIISERWLKKFGKRYQLI